jgi:hypothetical protein
MLCRLDSSIFRDTVVMASVSKVPSVPGGGAAGCFEVRNSQNFTVSNTRPIWSLRINPWPTHHNLNSSISLSLYTTPRWIRAYYISGMGICCPPSNADLTKGSPYTFMSRSMASITAGYVSYQALSNVFTSARSGYRRLVTIQL